MFLFFGVLATGCSKDDEKRDTVAEQNPSIVQETRGSAVTRRPSESESEVDNSSMTDYGPVCKDRAGLAEEAEPRLGDFTPPEDVPEYELIEMSGEQEQAGSGDARILEFLVDTKVSDEVSYSRIAREIKARYAGYDALVLEFTNLSENRTPYNGGAIIFNTPCGAISMGYVYGPPNMDGYVVEAGKRPSLYSSGQ